MEQAAGRKSDSATRGEEQRLACEKHGLQALGLFVGQSFWGRRGDHGVGGGDREAGSAGAASNVPPSRPV